MAKRKPRASEIGPGELACAEYRRKREERGGSNREEPGTGYQLTGPGDVSVERETDAASVVAHLVVDNGSPDLGAALWLVREGSRRLRRRPAATGLFASRRASVQFGSLSARRSTCATPARVRRPRATRRGGCGPRGTPPRTARSSPRVRAGHRPRSGPRPRVALLNDPEVGSGPTRRREALEELGVAHADTKLEARKTRLGHLEQR